MAVTIRQRPKGSGTWWIFINHQGKRKAKKIGKDKRLANEVAKKIEARLALGDLDLEEKPSFKKYADTWIKTTVPANCKPSSIKDYGDILRLHVLPAFGHLKVTDITRGQIKTFLFSKINEGKAKSTVNHYRAVISGVLNQALDAGVIPANPAHRLGRVGKREEGNGEINPLTGIELKKLLDTVQTDRELSSHYPVFLLFARTGIRLGEGFGLKWGDIDFPTRSIKVQRTYSKGRIGTPKSGKSRTVDMSNQLTDALLVLKQTRVIIPMNEGSDWIFTNSKGGLIDVDNWRRRVFKSALVRAEVRRIRIHDLRHTYATLRLSKGDNILDVANQLGDDVTTVLKVYAHWLPGKKKDEVDALDDSNKTQPIRNQGRK